MLVLTRCAIGLCVLASVVLAQEPTTLGEYEIPGHGALRLTMPNDWRVQSSPLSQPPSTTLNIIPNSGDAFDVQLTVLWLDASHLAEMSAQSIASNVRRSAEGLLDQAVESTVPIQELRGTQVIGSYYSLTDRAPAPGEFTYLTQGSFRIGELLTAFTILSREAAAHEVEQTLQMFRESHYAP